MDSGSSTRTGLPSDSEDLGLSSQWASSDSWSPMESPRQDPDDGGWEEQRRPAMGTRTVEAAVPWRRCPTRLRAEATPFIPQRSASLVYATLPQDTGSWPSLRVCQRLLVVQAEAPPFIPQSIASSVSATSPQGPPTWIDFNATPPASTASGYANNGSQQESDMNSNLSSDGDDDADDERSDTNISLSNDGDDADDNDSDAENNNNDDNDESCDSSSYEINMNPSNAELCDSSSGGSESDSDTFDMEKLNRKVAEYIAKCNRDRRIHRGMDAAASADPPTTVPAGHYQGDDKGPCCGGAESFQSERTPSEMSDEMGSLPSSSDSRPNQRTSRKFVPVPPSVSDSEDELVKLGRSEERLHERVLEDSDDDDEGGRRIDKAIKLLGINSAEEEEEEEEEDMPACPCCGSRLQRARRG